MNFNELDLKKLQKLIDLCHKNNVQTIEVDGIKLELGARPLKNQRRKRINEVIATDPVTGTQHVVELKTVADTIATDALTPEQLLYYSAGNGDM